MKITYIPDHEFHALVDAALANANPNMGYERECLDEFVTETMLGPERTWPKTWATLMLDANKESYIQRIMIERRQRQRRS
jgi:hypothetical protein